MQGKVSFDVKMAMILSDKNKSDQSFHNGHKLKKERSGP